MAASGGGAERGVTGRRRRLLLAGLAATLVGWGRAAPVAAQGADDDSARLLEEYAPVVAVRHQSEPCGDGERFVPVAVDAIFGRDDVVLRDADGEVVATAPTAADLAGGSEDRWIDLPGNTLDPGCTYEQWFDSLDADPAIYGRVIVDGEQVVVQYWFFWVYNQWNDVHEGDWEMMQIVFDAPTPAEALTAGPALYAYAQHEGSEYARVGDNDDKVELVDGTHAVVYPGMGSHAAYFSSSRWFGKSGATGFGCDDTRAPIDRLRPPVITLPDDVPTEGSFAWLSYEGHWGEKAPAFDNGPTGPITKTQWDEPVQWVDDEGRDTAVALPFAGSTATSAFCDLSAKGSTLFNRLLDRPLLVLFFTVLLVVAIIAIVRASSRGLLGRAARTWRRHARQLVPIGAVVVAGVAASLVVQAAILRWTRLGDLVDVAGESSAGAFAIVAVLGSSVAVPVFAWVAAATLEVEARDDAASTALREPLRRRAALLAVLVLIVVFGVAALLFLLPPAMFVLSRWLLAPAVCVTEGTNVRAGMRRSRQLVRGHGWRAFGLVATLGLVASVAGVIGALVLLLTPLGFTMTGLITALAGAVLVPYIALVVAHFYDEVRT